MQQLKPLKPGDAPADGPLSAACWNRVVSAVSSLEAIRRSGRCAPGGMQFPDPCIVRAKNSSGTDRGRFEVLGVDGSVFTPTSNLTQFQNAIYLDGKKPTADHLGKFVVLCQPLRAGAIGWAWAAGVCVVKVDCDYEDQPYADVKADDAGLLKGGEGGAAQVLWKEDGTGTKWAVIRLGAPTYPKLVGKLDGDLAAGSSATMSIWEGSTLADSGRDITVYDWFLPAGKKLASGARVAAVWNSGKWYVDTTDTCPT
jgi:hypothetical protein